MRRCAFLSMDDLSGFVSYDALVREPLRKRGWQLDEVSWRSAHAVWDEYDVVVIRTTWDYQQQPAAFLDTLERIAARTRLENSLAIVRWNLRKTYLRDLARHGVRTVPTLWGDDVDVVTLRAAFDMLGTDELIIKPQVGANADDTYRLQRSAARVRGAHADPVAHFPPEHLSLEHAARTFAQRPHMMQPFVRSVIDEGEFSLIFVDGQYSHTILKTPRQGDFRVQEEHGGEIRAVEPERALIEAARTAVAAIGDCVPQTGPATLYARADFVRMPDNGFALMELELIEPSLYLSYDRAAPTRLADAITRRPPQ